MIKILRPAAVAVVSMIMAACGGDIEPGTRTPDSAVIRGLELVRVAEDTVSGADAFVGTLESRDRGLLAARLDGRVERVAVRQGDVVKAGDLLLEIGDHQVADRLREAEAGVAEARDHLGSAQARLELAEKTYQRYRRLFENEAVTAQEMDRMAAEQQVARRSVQAAEAGVARAAAGRDAARISASFTRVLAPYDARVVRREVEAGSTVRPGTPLLVLDRAGGWQVSAAIPESRSGRVAVGDPVTVIVPAVGKSYRSRVSQIEPAADPRSRSFGIKAELPEDADLTAGLFARMVFPGAERSTLLVPAAAVVRRGQLSGVYVVEDGYLRYRLVRTGREADGRIEILSGLDSGATIVGREVERARSGARVED